MTGPRVAEERKLQLQSVSRGELTWVNIEKPTAREIEYLAQNYPFHPLDLEDCLGRIQHPKLDDYPDYLFIVLHFPLFNRAAGVTTPSQVAFFIGANYLITVHSGELKTLVRFFHDCQSSPRVRDDTMSHSSGYLLYQILKRLVDYCFPILNRVISNVEEMEDQVFGEEAREAVRELTMVRRDIIAFRRIIRPQIGVIASLEHKERPFLKEELETYYSDIADSIAQMWDALEDQREVVEGLLDAQSSFASHRLNEIVRILTIISTIMLPLSVVSGIYGMNVPIPWESSPYSFLGVLALMALMGGGMLAFFRRQGWL